jgi:hypothetical protein
LKRLWLVLIASGSSLGAQAVDTVWTRVTYLSGQSVYIDAGTQAGLAEGSRLEVVRGGTMIARLVVAFVSSTRASCTVEQSTIQVEVGDSVRFTTRHTARVAIDSSPNEKQLRRPRASSRSVRGRLGARYLVMQPGASAGAYTQPALDLRLDATRPGGAPVGAAIDVRARRTRLTGPTARPNESITRTYQASLWWNPNGSPTRLSVGRQFATTLSAVGILDGIALDYDRSHVSAGAFVGNQPDPVSFGLSSEIREYGLYLQTHGAPNGTSPWSLTSGAIGSYARGKVDREYLYLQAVYAGRVVSLYATQEVDYNRGWKVDAGEKRTSPTATYASVRIAPIRELSINAGYDNRRAVRLYRDFVNPETEFDDSFRQGMWGGASLDLFGHLRFDADTRTNRGGTTGRGNSYTLSGGLTRLSPLRLGVRARSTHYTSDRSDGSLRSASFELSPRGVVRVELNAGERDDKHVVEGVTSNRLQWFGADADMGLGRSVYLLLSLYRERLEGARNTQSYVALSYRF